MIAIIMYKRPQIYRENKQQKQKQYIFLMNLEDERKNSFKTKKT